MFKSWRLKVYLVSLIIGVIFAGLFMAGFWFKIRYSLTDKLFINRPAGNQVIIVAIDNESLSQVGRWPWSRSVYAKLIEVVDQGNPKRIGFDVNISEPSNFNDDNLLARSLASSSRVILPLEVSLKKTTGYLQAANLLEPLAALKNVAQLGISNMPLDSDGIVRRVPIILKSDNNQEYDSFAYLLADSNKGSLKPYLDSSGSLLINFSGGPGSIAKIKALDVLKIGFDKSIFKDKIVVIGVTAPDLHDEQMVPTSGGRLMSGVEIHAQAINTLLNGNYLLHVGQSYQFIFLLILSLLVALLINYFKLIWSTFSSIGLILSWLAFAAVLFENGYIVDIFFPVLVIFWSYAGSVAVRFLTELNERKQIKMIFGMYLAPQVVEQVVTHKQLLEPGGERKRLTVMFCDIRNFSSYSEKVEPSTLVDFLNVYLSEMSEQVLKTEGVIDKYIGDAIMAFWGAPFDQADQEKRSLDSALGMMSVVDNKRVEWKEQFGIDLDIGIGMHTGEAIVGNLGSKKRFDYTVIGDTVNLASRLEGLNKFYGTKIIVSKDTMSKLGSEYVFRHLDKVVVKGKTQPTDIFELVGLIGNVASDAIENISLFEAALVDYRLMRWQEALVKMEKLKKSNKQDKAVDLYIERINKLLAVLPERFDGINYLDEK